MKDGSVYTCDRCGAIARGFIPQGWTKFWPPARWIWGFGFEDLGPHGCSEACWWRIQDAHRAATGKVYIPDDHARWEHVHSDMTEEPPPPPPFDPAEFNLRGLPVGTARAPRPPPVPQVYFAQDGDDGPIKIGTSKYVARRLRSLQISAPRPLRLLGTMPGGHGLERELHRQFADLQVHGEWFRPESPLTEYIRTHAASSPASP